MIRTFLATAVVVLAMLIAGCVASNADLLPSDRSSSHAIRYPQPHRSAHVDVYSGTDVADPYHWMESVDAPETGRWITAENALTNRYLARLPGRAAIAQRLTALWHYERWGLPVVRGGRYFYAHNTGAQKHNVVFVSNSLSKRGHALINPNELSDGETHALAHWTPSPDGKWVAYAESTPGSDWTTLHVRSVATGRDLPGVISDTKFTQVAWLPDGSGFYYSRYPLDERGEADDSQPVSVYFHQLNTLQSADRKINAIPAYPNRNPYAQVSEDGAYLLIVVRDGFDANAIYYQRLHQSDATITPLLDAWDGLYTFLGNDGSVFYFATTLDAPRGRVIALDIRSPQRTYWREVIPQRTATLENVVYTGGRFFATYVRAAHSVVRVYDRFGDHLTDVDMPGAGTVVGFHGTHDAAETFYSYTGYTTAPIIYHYDIRSGQSQPYREATVPVDNHDTFVVDNVVYHSKDGTQVPMSIIHKKDIKRDGANPTLLSGDRAFGESLTSAYSPARIAWLEMGGVDAVVHFRAADEHRGPSHQTATKQRQRQVVDEFIAAADYLRRRGYTNPDKLAIQGGHNSALLVGAVLTQRPKLAAAVLPNVGVVGGRPYHAVSANAASGTSDYGIAHDSEALFKTLAVSSLVDNTRPGTCYPATLISTAEHNNRVAPWHGYKLAAALQHAQGCDNPILIRIETRTGHGGVKPLSMYINDVASQYAFIMQALGMNPADK